MEMDVDAKRIRLERERRAWTQAQLAGATALGLRTVQRIEREGSASFESAQAIAAALELAIADLRREPKAEAPAVPFALRVAFAALSGVAVALYLDRREGFLFWEPIDYFVPACLFAAAVLCPEVRVGRTFVRRVLALVAASTLSFYVAVTIAVEAPEWLGSSVWGAPTLYSALLASIAGAGIVLVAARWLIGFDRAARFWVVGALAAVLGGVAIYVGLEIYDGHFVATAASFAAWHTLLCVAMRAGRRGSAFGKDSLRDACSAVRRLLPGGTLWRSGFRSAT